MKKLLIDPNGMVLEVGTEIERISWKGKERVLKITRTDGFVYYNESFNRDEYVIENYSGTVNKNFQPYRYKFIDDKLVKNREFTYQVFNEHTKEMITFDVDDKEISRESIDMGGLNE